LIFEVSDFCFRFFQALFTGTKLSLKLVDVPGELSLRAFGAREFSHALHKSWSMYIQKLILVG
jgi:hypothetical protein